jgi:hypothetical protein
MQEDGKGFPELSLQYSKQPNNNTLRYLMEVIFRPNVLSYQLDNNSITLDTWRLKMPPNPC